MDRLSEITFLLPDAPQARGFLDELRSLFAEVAYADFTGSAGKANRVGDRLTLTPPQPAGARPVTTFALADVHTPERPRSPSAQVTPSVHGVALTRTRRGPCRRMSRWRT
ncbi:hypothetical protein [Streptomyces sp. NPDC012510]|uniref:hypothetical protein n=1 Tax=Streptomyces sp. NPDC012510 TaxID=3364838 RepID=UPI0036EE34CD